MSDATGTAAHDADLLAQALGRCASEPIHLVGAVQKQGIVLALDDAGRVQLASDNLEPVFGTAAADALGRPVAGLIGDANWARVQSMLATLGAERSAPLAFATDREGASMALSVLAHRSGALTLLDIQPLALSEFLTSVRSSFPQLRASLLKMDEAPDLDAFCAGLAEEMRRQTGFDRVMVYRFDEHWNGEVVSESRIDALPPLLHHHFPASDIPPQARGLYEVNLVRILCDVDAPTVPIVPAIDPRTGQPLDLSRSAFRAVSGVHLGYLRNMGVRSTMTVSLLHERRLWGLIACHGLAPRTIPLETVELGELISRSASAKLAALDNEHRLVAMADLRSRLDRIARALQSSRDMGRVLRRIEQDCLEVAEASGACLLVDGESTLLGDVPGPALLDPLAAWVRQQRFDNSIFATDRLGQAFPPAEACRATASGLLAVALDSRADSLLLWFRPEQVREIPWAGRPHEEVMVDEAGPRLEPRRSFKAWLQTVRGCSKSWNPVTIWAVEMFSFSLLQLLLRKAQRRAVAADASNRARRDFLANMSHEIRTPLSAIVGMGDMLRATGLSPQQGGYLDRICGSAERLMRLLNDIIDLSRIDAGRLTLESTEFDLRKVLDSVRMLGEVAARDRDLRMIVNVGPDCPPRLVGDPWRLEQILTNLAGNALKFTPKGEVRIEAAWRPAGSQPGLLSIEVHDTGVGIQPEVLARLFQRYSQASASTPRVYGGSGLGLEISQRLAALMGGQIDARSRPGEGSVFTFRAPFEVAPDSPAADIAAPSGPVPDAAGLRVLLVEDNEILQQVVENGLVAAGVKVDVAPNGEAALAMCDDRLYDVVLLDLTLPGIDGFETAARLRANPACREVAIIAVTAGAMQDDRARCLAAGMDDYLKKPVSPGRLCEALARVAQRRRGRA